MLESITMKWTGVSPLLMHRGGLADKQDAYTKEIKKYTDLKKKKTESDEAQIRKLEWKGSLNLDDNGRPAVSGDQALACLVDGARRRMLGKDVIAGAMPASTAFALEYEGPKNVDKLYEVNKFVDVRGVKVGKSRIMRTRPRFNAWSVTVTFEYDPSLVNREQIIDAALAAGESKGIGDYRPRFGRFTVDVVS
jgi:hypothetical protein